VLNLAAYRNSLARSTKSTSSHIKVLRSVVDTRFQVLFHSPPGVLFTFPSRYFFAIGHQVVFSLRRWSSLIPTRFLVSRGTLAWTGFFRFSFTGLLPSLAEPSSSLQLTYLPLMSSRTPGTSSWFGLFPFRSPLLRKSIFLSLPPGT
jgi:hypothetical protein